MYIQLQVFLARWMRGFITWKEGHDRIIEYSATVTIHYSHPASPIKFACAREKSFVEMMK
jgi:hypothetical protein